LFFCLSKERKDEDEYTPPRKHNLRSPVVFGSYGTVAKDG
jgi:hypothetical protein